MNKPLDGLNEVGKIPQSGNGSVDEGSGDGQVSRAREGEGDLVARPAELAAKMRLSRKLAVKGVTLNALMNAFPELRLIMLAQAVDNLEATVQCWNAKLQTYEEKVDHATRQKALAWLADRSDGLPVQTNMNLNANISETKDGDEGMAQALESPAMREELRRRLDAAERRSREKSEKKNATPV